MNRNSINRLTLSALIIALSASSLAIANSTVWVQIEQGNEALVPLLDTNFSITAGYEDPPQFTDENGDTQTDTAKFTWTNANLPTSITVSFILTSSFDVISVTATHRASGNLIMRSVDSAAVTFTLGTDSDTLVEIELAPSRQPVSCLVAPDANTLTGSPVIWGQAYHTARRSFINPNNPAYPVDLFSGDVTEKVVDLHVKGRGLDFVWSRRYHSSGTEDSEIGNDWDHSYNISIQEDFSAGKALVRMGNARTAIFSQTNIVNNRQFLHADGWAARVVNNITTSEVTLDFGNGTIWAFFGSGVTRGKLDTITDRYGNVIDLTYDVNGRLTSITDTLDRSYTLAYGTDGFIDTLTEDDGLSRVITYDHYVESDTEGNEGDLRSVTYPGTRDLTYTYQESSTFSQDRGDLLTIEDGRGNVVLTNTYDPSSRATSQTWGSDGSTDSVVIFDFPSSPTGLDTMAGETQKTIVNDGEGNVTEFFFNATNQLLRTLEYTGRAVADVVTTESANRPANQLRSGDPATYETTFTWNSNDLLTERVNPSGNSVALTYETNRRRIANILTIDHSNVADTLDLSEEFTYEDDWDAGPNSLSSCRCGETFIETHTILDTDNEADFEIAYQFDIFTGDRTGISYGALTGFPTAFDETFTFNANGQVLTHTHPGNDSDRNREDTFTYTTAAMTGYLETEVVDSGTGGTPLTTSFEYDAVGNVIRYALPRQHALGVTAGVLDDGEASLIYNSNDELTSVESPVIGGGNTSRNLKDFVYDANGNVTDIDVANRNEVGTTDTNIEFTTTHTYDTLNRRTQTVAEIDDDPTSATTAIGYNRNGLPILISSPESVAGNEVTNREHLQYDERDLLYRSVRGLGNAKQISTQFDYDVNGNLETRTAGLEESVADQRVTGFTYDEFDRLNLATDPAGNTADHD